MTDVPTVFQLTMDEKWYMTFIGFDGNGYQSFIAESDDLVHTLKIKISFCIIITNVLHHFADHLQIIWDQPFFHIMPQHIT